MSFPQRDVVSVVPQICSYVFIVLIGLGVYFNALSTPFLWDDTNFIVENHLLRDVKNIPVVFKSNIASGSPVSYHFYRPLQEVTHMMDYHLWGLDVRGHHLTSIALHIGVAMLAMHLIFFLSGKALLSFCAASLYVVHPVHVEAVTYLSGRGDLLAAFFMLSCCLVYFKNDQHPLVTKIFMLLPLSLLAFFSKELCMMLPLLLMGYHFFFRRKVHFLHLLPIVISVCLYIGIHLFVLGDTGTVIAQTRGGYARIPGFFNALISYFRILMWPFHLHFDYGQKLFSFLDVQTIIGLVFSVIFITGAVLKRHKYPVICFFIFWFFLMMAPYSNIYLIFAYMADHNLYFPSIGFFVVFSAGLIRLHVYLGKQKWIKFFLPLLIIFWGSLTVIQNQYWSHPVLFYKRILAYNTSSASAYHNLGVAYGRQGDDENEIKHYHKAISIEPSNATFHKNLGYAYINKGSLRKAHYHLGKAVELDPNHFSAYTGFGIVLDHEGDYLKAVEYYQKALRINPYYAAGLYNLAMSYFNQKNYDQALEATQQLLNLNATYTEGYYLKGLIYHLKGDAPAAMGAFRETVRLAPHHKKAYFHIAVLLKNQGDRYEAEELLKHHFLNPVESQKVIEELRQLP